MRTMALSWWQAAGALAGLSLSACGGAGGDGGAASTQTALGTGACTVAFSVQSSWEQGYVGNLTVSTGAALSGWTLGFDFTNGETIQNLWNGEASQLNGQVSVTNASYDASISANGSFVVGYVANDDGTHVPPSSFRLNGTLCDAAVAPVAVARAAAVRERRPARSLLGSTRLRARADSQARSSMARESSCSCTAWIAPGPSSSAWTGRSSMAPPIRPRSIS